MIPRDSVTIIPPRSKVEVRIYSKGSKEISLLKL
jgi:hypothetical protein